MRGQNRGVRVSRSALLLMSAAVILAIGVSSCAKPPQMEKDQATASIDKAKQMEAPEYAPNDLKAAQDSLAAADAEVNTQQGKFALFRSYKKAKALYLSAQQLGQTAADNAVKNKAQAKADAEAAVDAAKKSIADARTLLASKDVMALKRGKETREQLKQIETEINSIDSSLSQVTALQQQEKYKQALAMAKSANDNAQAKISEVNQALEARKQTMQMGNGAKGK